MSALRFKQVDVFTDRPFVGNPVAVVLDGDGLDAPAMQRIAAWTNLSETTFVLRPTAPGADYRVRIFTPRSELPFAGHPTIGTAHAVLEAGVIPPKAELRQECAAGLLRLDVEGAGVGRRIAVEVPPATLEPLPAEVVGEVERALGAPLAGDAHLVAIGPRWLTLRLADAGAVRRLAPDMAAVAAVSRALGATGITVFALTDAGDHRAVVRSFAPGDGIPGMPGATSSATCCACVITSMAFCSALPAMAFFIGIGRSGIGVVSRPHGWSPTGRITSRMPVR
jgi:PhzF family phenazine biosynthesis protein